MFSSRIFALTSLLSILGLGTVGQLHAGLTDFKGTWNGLALIAQGDAKKGVRTSVSALIKVAATTKSAKFTITGQSDGKPYTQTITLAGGKATYSAILPAIDGFQVKSEGTYKVAGKRITISSPTQASNYALAGRIEFLASGKTLVITSLVTFEGSKPIYVTMVANP